MTGFRPSKIRADVFRPRDRIVTLTGSKGIVLRVKNGEAEVRLEDGSVLWLRFSHLCHEDYFFGRETSRWPGG